MSYQYSRSLSKKLSGLLHTDENDWSDLGLTQPGDHNNSFHNDRSLSRSPIHEEDDNNHASEHEPRPEAEGEEGPESLERWTSSSSLSRGNTQPNREPARRKSSEMSSTMKSRLEAFERARKEEEEERERAKRAVELENNEHVGHFREKLKNFQKISSQTDLGVSSGDQRARSSVSSERKPPPPLSYSKLIEVSWLD